MLYLQDQDGMLVVILTPTHIEALLKGSGVKTPDGKVFVLFSPDVVWMNGQLKPAVDAECANGDVIQQIHQDSFKRAQLPIEDGGMRKLEKSLAYEMASGLIDSDSFTKPGGWNEVDTEGEVELFDAIRYLEARGLLERHSEHANWVKVREEGEAIDG